MKHRGPEEVELALVDLASEDPSPGQKRAGEVLHRSGIFISAAMIIWVGLPSGRRSTFPGATGEGCDIWLERYKSSRHIRRKATGD